MMDAYNIKNKSLFIMMDNPFLGDIRNTHPDKVILVQGRERITAGQLMNAIINQALLLQKIGVRKESKVVMLLPPNKEFVSSVLACLSLGALISIIDPEMGKDNFNDKFRQLNPDFLLIDSRLLLIHEHILIKTFINKVIKKQLPSFPKEWKGVFVSCGQWMPILRKHINSRWNPRQVISNPVFTEGDHSLPSLITYTSGTIGAPKGVVHSIDNIYNSMQHLKKLLKEHNSISLATHLPHYLLLGIISGNEVHVWNQNMSGSNKIKYITKNNISSLFGPPSDFMSMIHHVSRNDNKFPECLKNIYLGSAPVYPNFLEKLLHLMPNKNITCLYGMTENLLVSSISAKEKVALVYDGDVVGRPFESVAVEILADGEIALVSPQSYLGYFEQSPRSGMHNTGDLGMIAKDGNIVLLGRKKDMIIRRNFNIYPGLYEPTISKIQGIEEAVLVGIYDPILADEEVYLCIQNNAPITAEYVIQQLKVGQNSIDVEALPDKILFMPLPRSGRQMKINKAEIRVLIQEMKNQNKIGV